VIEFGENLFDFGIPCWFTDAWSCCAII